MAKQTRAILSKATRNNFRFFCSLILFSSILGESSVSGFTPQDTYIKKMVTEYAKKKRMMYFSYKFHSSIQVLFVNIIKLYLSKLWHIILFQFFCLKKNSISFCRFYTNLKQTITVENLVTRLLYTRCIPCFYQCNPLSVSLRQI